MLKIFITNIIAFFLSACTTHSPQAPLKTVDKVDIKRYMGKWIEIARYENSFEEGCLGASAEYKPTKKGIEVTNRCYDEKGALISEAKGKAYATDSSNAKLKVSFFWPFYGNYQVIMLADDYSYAVVGEPKRKYLWILARSKQLTEDQKEFILQQLPSFGYDPTKLYWTEVRP